MKNTYYVARDSTGYLYLFRNRPRRVDGIWCSRDWDEPFTLDSALFPELKWKNKPLKVKLIFEKI